MNKDQKTRWSDTSVYGPLIRSSYETQWSTQRQYILKDEKETKQVDPFVSGTKTKWSAVGNLDVPGRCVPPDDILYPLYLPVCPCGMRLQPWGQEYFTLCKQGFTSSEAMYRLRTLYMYRQLREHLDMTHDQANAALKQRKSILPSMRLRDCCAAKILASRCMSQVHMCYQDMAQHIRSMDTYVSVVERVTVANKNAPVVLSVNPNVL